MCSSGWLDVSAVVFGSFDDRSAPSSSSVSDIVFKVFSQKYFPRRLRLLNMDLNATLGSYPPGSPSLQALPLEGRYFLTP